MAGHHNPTIGEYTEHYRLNAECNHCHKIVDDIGGRYAADKFVSRAERDFECPACGKTGAHFFINTKPRTRSRSDERGA